MKTSLSVQPAFVAYAFSVVWVETLKGVEYTGDVAVGVVPSSV